MPDKDENKKKRSTPKTTLDPQPISQGIMTTNHDSLVKGEVVNIYKDKGEDWITDKGSIPKIYMLLKKLK